MIPNDNNNNNSMNATSEYFYQESQHEKTKKNHERDCDEAVVDVPVTAAAVGMLPHFSQHPCDYYLSTSSGSSTTTATTESNTRHLDEPAIVRLEEEIRILQNSLQSIEKSKEDLCTPKTDDDDSSNNNIMIATDSSKEYWKNEYVNAQIQLEQEERILVGLRRSIEENEQRLFELKHTSCKGRE